MATDEDEDEDADDDDDDADEDEDEMIITAASSAYRNDSVRDLDLSVQRFFGKWGNRFLKGLRVAGSGAKNRFQSHIDALKKWLDEELANGVPVETNAKKLGEHVLDPKSFMEQVQRGDLVVGFSDQVPWFGDS